MAKADVARAVAVTAELTGANLGEAALGVLVSHLLRYPEPTVLRALERCRLELRRPLTLADALDRIDDGHPGPEEAWSLVAGTTEDETLIVTDEIMAAWAVARPLIQDRVAGRLAFLERYRELLAVARGQGKAPRWWASLGSDPAGRVAALSRAVELRRLSMDEAKKILQAHLWPPAWSPERALPELQASKQQAAEVVAMLTRRLAASAREDGR